MSTASNTPGNLLVVVPSGHNALGFWTSLLRLMVPEDVHSQENLDGAIAAGIAVQDYKRLDHQFIQLSVRVKGKVSLSVLVPRENVVAIVEGKKQDFPVGFFSGDTPNKAAPK